ncbi:esterase/lipase family protein [Saccharothrix australiensis]|uniref:Alpha/beta hydrolase family protein n=1 Tax=Saccharothrix australiensis TaxID=2072 RepID=A0A495W8W8_9PSEU|nr:alpha/beta fold hydrolase [Saccharothrix australiensis]RKT57654.1 alpha/beta hydrolase family protein [Saccharothrix australiensis]
MGGARSIFERVGTGLRAGVGAVRDAVGTGTDAVRDAVGTGADALRDAVGSGVDAVRDAVGTGTDAVAVGTGTDVVGTGTDVVGTDADTVRDAVGIGTVRDAVGARADAVRQAVGAGADVVGGVLGGVAGVARGVATPGGVRGAVVEAAWLAAHAVLYPWGALEQRWRPEGHLRHYRTDRLSPRRRGLLVSAMDAAGTPIVLVHGIGDNRSAFAVLSGALRRRGFGVVHAVNFSVLTALTGDVRRSAALLGEHVERICEQTGSDRVHVVGHSLGGLIARYYVQRLRGDARVRTLITLGTPHGGTLAAYLFPTSLTRQLRPGSELLSELAAPCPPCRTRFVVVWSELDQVVIPQRHARLEHPSLLVEEHQIRDSGHLSLPVDTRTVHVIVTAATRPQDTENHPIVPVSEGFASATSTDRHLAPPLPSP